MNKLDLKPDIELIKDTPCLTAQIDGLVQEKCPLSSALAME